MPGLIGWRLQIISTNAHSIMLNFSQIMQPQGLVARVALQYVVHVTNWCQSLPIIDTAVCPGRTECKFLEAWGSTTAVTCRLCWKVEHANIIDNYLKPAASPAPSLQPPSLQNAYTSVQLHSHWTRQRVYPAER